MLLKINNPVRAEIFSTLFQNLKLFSDNVNISFTDEKMDIQCIDSGQVAIIEVHIGKDWFDHYELSSDGTSVIGANTNIIAKIMGTRDKSQNISLACDDEPDRLTMRFTSEDKNIYDKTFEMPLIDLDMEIMEIPETEYQAEFSLPSNIYATLMSQLKLFGDTMDIECSEDNIILHSNSIDNGKMSTEISIDDLNEFAIDEDEKLKISYSLTYMHNVSQFHKLSKDIELKFKQDYPAQLKYNLGTDDANVLFYIAPKITDYDD
jgi:proliferating cell nuclear antigen PCNA